MRIKIDQPNRVFVLAVVACVGAAAVMVFATLVLGWAVTQRTITVAVKKDAPAPAPKAAEEPKAPPPTPPKPPKPPRVGPPQFSDEQPRPKVVPKPGPDLVPVLTITDGELWEAYRDNEAAANKKFAFKVIEVKSTGLPRGCKPHKNGLGKYDLELPCSTGYVVVAFREDQNDRLAAMDINQPGMTVTVRGTCRGRDVYWSRVIKVVVGDAVLVSVVKER